MNLIETTQELAFRARVRDWMDAHLQGEFAPLRGVGPMGSRGYDAALVKRPSRNSPEWQRRQLKSSADARDFVADLKKKLAGWSDRDE